MFCDLVNLGIAVIVTTPCIAFRQFWNPIFYVKFAQSNTD